MTVVVVVLNVGLYLTGLIPDLNFWQMLVTLAGLWLFGAYVERRLGSLAFLGIYAALAASTGLLATAIDGSIDPVAAGVLLSVAGLGVSHLALAPRSRILVLVPIPFAMTFLEVPTLALLIGWVALELLLTLPG